jgi:hypothetical protein
MRFRQMLVILVLLLGVAGCRSENKDGPREAAPAVEPAAPEGGTPIELAYVPEGFPLGLSVSQGFALHLFDTPGGSQKFGTLPPETGVKRHYDEFTIAGANHLVITEESSPFRLYFDENRNGDMTDDRGPFTAEKPGFLPNNISIQIRYDAEKVVAPYRLWLFSSNMGGVRFYPACHWQGTLPLPDGSYRMVAFDGNADGDYANDPLVIDANGDGTASDEEKLGPGQTIALGGTTVKFLGLSPSGLTARLSW